MTMHTYRRGFTMVELLVTVAVSATVFGLILGVLVSTNTASNEVVRDQLMRQEALLASQQFERIVRYRVASNQVRRPDDAAPLALTSATVAAAAVPRDPERFAADELVLMSLAESGEEAAKEMHAVTAAVRNGGGVGNASSHAYIELRDLSAGGGAIQRRELGSNPEKMQTQISFRYASDATTSGVRWQLASPTQVPTLIEYTVRVWPNEQDFRNFSDARDATGRPIGFIYTSAVRLP